MARASDATGLHIQPMGTATSAIMRELSMTRSAGLTVERLLKDGEEKILTAMPRVESLN